jgi:transposase
MDSPESAAAAAPPFVGFVGSKATLDVALRPAGAPWRCANAEAGIADLVARLQPLAPQLIVLKATSGLERLAVAALALAGLSVAVVNPRHLAQGRDFAKATGRLAKTDALDAAVRAHVAEAIRPVPRSLSDAVSQALAALVERRRQLVGMLTAEKNRLGQALPPVRPTVAAHIAWLEKALKELDADLDQTLRAYPLWREREALLRSVPGIGPTVALTLLAHRPELGQGPVKHVATWVGLAPLNRDRGAWRGSLSHLGRSTPGALLGAVHGGAVHGGASGRAPQSGPARPLRAADGARQAQAGRLDCLYA